MSNKPADDEGKFWQIFGKVSAVLFTIGVIVGIIAALIPKTPTLRVQGISAPYQVSPDLVAAFTAARNKESYQFLDEYLKKYFAEGKITTENLTGKSYYDLGGDLSKIFDSAWGSSYYTPSYSESLGPYEYYFRITAINKGPTTAKNAELVTPLSGEYSLSSNEGSKKSSDFDHQISLGDLKPGTTTVIELWSRRNVDLFNEKSFFITHDQGTKRVQFPLENYGFWKAVIQNIFWAPFILVVIGFLVWLTIAIRAASNKNLDQESETRDTPDSSDDSDPPKRTDVQN